MKQEDKELLLKDLSARLPYNCKVFYEYVDDLDSKTYGYSLTLNTWCIDELNADKAVIKPYLRPMSSMTEEESKELSILCGIKDILSTKITDEYIEFVVDDGFCSTEIRTIWYDEIISSIEIFDWLNAHYFDYRGFIESGLAVKVTKENNPYNE